MRVDLAVVAEEALTDVWTRLVALHVVWFKLEQLNLLLYILTSTPLTTLQYKKKNGLTHSSRYLRTYL